MQFCSIPCIYIHHSCLKHRFLPRSATTCPSCTAARRVGPTADGAPERISAEVRFECVLKKRLQGSQILRFVYRSIRFPICFCQSSFYRRMQHFVGNFIPALPAGDFPGKNRRRLPKREAPRLLLWFYFAFLAFSGSSQWLAQWEQSPPQPPPCQPPFFEIQAMASTKNTTSPASTRML